MFAHLNKTVPAVNVPLLGESGKLNEYTNKMKIPCKNNGSQFKSKSYSQIKINNVAS
jgi:hypothetical protein